MMFPTERLGDLPLEIVDGDRGSNYPKTGEFSQSGYCLFLNAGNVTSTGFNFSDTAFISKEKDELLRKGKAKQDDVILTTRGTVGNLALYDESAPFQHIRINSGMVLIRADQAKLDPEFLYYALRSPAFAGQVASLQTGSAQPQLPIRDIKHLEIPFPELGMQKELSKRVKLLFDKIELNRRMNETLEEMARALFRDWFVDFGPTRRQIEGATDPAAIMGRAFPPEKAATLATLFPARLVDDGLPEGWSKKPVGELAEIVGGGTPNTKTEEFWESGTHLWATPRDLSKLSGVFVSDTERRLSDAGLAKVSSGLSPRGSVLMSSRAPIGYLAIASKPVAVNQGFIVLRPTDAFPTHFAKLWCEANMETIEANANGSTFQEISKKNFKPILVTVPSMDVMTAFSNVAGLLFDKVQANELENQTLAEMRDLLLPKLMSGEIRLTSGEF